MHRASIIHKLENREMYSKKYEIYVKYLLKCYKIRFRIYQTLLEICLKGNDTGGAYVYLFSFILL